MKSLIKNLILFSTALLFSITGCSQNTDTSSPEAYINLVEGGRWVYKVEITTTASDGEIVTDTSLETRMVTGTEKVNDTDCYVMEILTDQAQNPKSFLELNPDKGLLLKRQDYLFFDGESNSLKYAEAVITPPRLMVKFPLTAGSTWTQVIPAGDSTMSAAFVVRQSEKVETPAGAFNAIKIEAVGGSPDSIEFTAFQWYAKDIGLVKEVIESKTEQGVILSTVSLKEFTRENSVRQN